MFSLIVSLIVLVIGYLVKGQKMYSFSLLTALPAVFMTAVSLTYILMADEGFSLSASIAYPIGIGLSLALFCLYHFTRAMARRGKLPQKNKN